VFREGQRRRIRRAVCRQTVRSIPTATWHGAVRGNGGGTRDRQAHRPTPRRAGLGGRQSGSRRSLLFQHSRRGAVMPTGVEILLVEDNANDAELTLRALKQPTRANQVFLCRDGAEALDFFSNGASPVPKVVLLDLKLPKVDGLEVLRWLKKEARTKSIPVVVLTSSREEPDIERAYALGANSYIVKPVDFEAFARAVSDVGLYWLLLTPPPQ